MKKIDNKIKIFVIQTHKDSRIELDVDEMGSGFNKALSIVMSIFVSDPRIVLLDEPDLSMHPKLIKELINYIRNLGKQLIISSHNEIFINEFAKEQVKYVEYFNPFHSDVKPYSALDDEGKIFEALGIDIRFRRSALFSKDLILLVERPNDEDYIRLLLHKTGLDNVLNRYRISFINTGGKKTVEIQEFDRLNNGKIRILYVRVVRLTVKSRGRRTGKQSRCYN